MKAVVLRVSSPGGVATVADMIWQELDQLAEEKPLIVSMGSVAASGGYYIAAPAMKILAEPTTITGSIGVIGLVPSASRLKEKWGVSIYTFSGSQRKGLIDPGTKLSKEDSDVIGKTIDETYQTFLSRVADGRAMSMEEVHKLAQGRVYTGSQALENKLIDQIGGMKEALQEAKLAAGMDPNELYPLYRYEVKSTNLSECFTSIGAMRRCFRSTRINALMPEAPFTLPAWTDQLQKSRWVTLVQWHGSALK